MLSSSRPCGGSAAMACRVEGGSDPDIPIPAMLLQKHTLPGVMDMYRRDSWFALLAQGRQSRGGAKLALPGGRVQSNLSRLFAPLDFSQVLPPPSGGSKSHCNFVFLFFPCFPPCQVLSFSASKLSGG